MPLLGDTVNAPVINAPAPTQPARSENGKPDNKTTTAAVSDTETAAEEPLSRKEKVTKPPTLSTTNVAAKFQQADTDSNGKVSVTEIQSLDVEEKDARIVVLTFDEDGDTQLDLVEMTKALAFIAILPKFKAADTNGNAKLSLAEVEALDDVDATHAQAVVKMFDMNGDNELNGIEFLQVMEAAVKETDREESALAAAPNTYTFQCIGGEAIFNDPSTKHFMGEFEKYLSLMTRGSKVRYPH